MMSICPINSANCHESLGAIKINPFPWRPQTNTRHFSDIEIGIGRGREKKKVLFEDLCCEERQRGEDNKENMMKVSGRRRVAVR